MTVDGLLSRYELRKTNIRKDVLNSFINSEGRALSHSQLEVILEDTDRVTLYRTLKTFEQKGLIHQAVDGSGIMKFALCGHQQCAMEQHSHQHAHFNCQKCGNTICLDEALTSSIQTPAGYTVADTHIILKGICESCNS